jgi:RNA polymerase sigma-70 factor (ECF subfamily)
MDDAREEGRGPSLRVVPGGAAGAGPVRQPQGTTAPASSRGTSSSFERVAGEPVEARTATVDEDTALVGAFLLGNDAAFGALVRRHEELVLRIVRRYAATADDARDLAQRTFLRAFEAARRAFGRAGESFPFRRWLIRVAVNLAKNHLRDEARWTRLPADAIRAAAAATGPAPADALERAERAARLRREVLNLPRRQREVLTLRIDAELPFGEIADALGITENAAKVSFHHATRRLRLALEEDGL